MKILYYNWVDYLDDEKRGGGVSVYQRNVLAEIDKHPDMDATFLSSGMSYDFGTRAPRWEKTRHGPRQDRQRRYEIVNSGVMSPAHHSFGNPAQVDHAATHACFFDFLEKTGPYDVLHFNNLEGIPASVLDIKSRWPNTRVLFTMHNFYPFCSQVNLWHQERAHCVDFEGGGRCGTCLPERKDEAFLRIANAVAYALKKRGLRPGSKAFGGIFRIIMGVGRRVEKLVRRFRPPSREHLLTSSATPADGATFAHRRRDMVRLINAHCDRVICPSEATARIAVEMGVAGHLVDTVYIGTNHAERYKASSPILRLPRDDGTIHLAFLGYMRRDKGFFFLLDALEAMPSDLSARIRLTVAARRAGAEVVQRLFALENRLLGVTYFDGYRHDQLDSILADVDLGVVPSLWHDILPQVAIEMHARRKPLLTSDMGGAQELAGHNELFTFPAGDMAQFHTRLRDILDGHADLGAYWDAARAPISMADHLSDLRHLYGEQSGGSQRSEPMTDRHAGAI